MARIGSLEVTEEGLCVVWDGDVPASRFPWFWLRDHGHEEATLHPVTRQRQVFTAAIPDDVLGSAARVAEDGSAVVVDWRDGGQSRWPFDFLWQFRDPRPGTLPSAAPVTHWDAAAIAAHPPRVPYTAVKAGDDGLARWLEAVEAYGFCLVDGLRIADELRAAEPEAYETLAAVEVTGQYLGDGAHLVATRPVLRHEHGRLVQVTFNNYDRAPFRLPDAEMRAFYRALKAFETLANAHRLQWRHPLRPGEVLLFDNWRTLHGRAAYRGARRLCGAYLNREDFDSRLRLLRQSEGQPDATGA